jgi:hypothetical protein
VAILLVPLVAETYGRIAGIRALLGLLDNAIPRSEWHENEMLKRRAEEGDWEFGDFSVERDILDERFQFWLPRFAAYSIITLLYTVVETQLDSCARAAHRKTAAAFAPKDIRGQGIEAAATYLARIGTYDVRQDGAWSAICDLRDLRHLIVHRAGTKGQSKEHRDTANRLAATYPGIEFPDSDWTWYGEVWIPLPLCRRWIDTVEQFFDRIFDAFEWLPEYRRRAANTGVAKSG